MPPLKLKFTQNDRFENQSVLDKTLAKTLLEKYKYKYCEGKI